MGCRASWGAVPAASAGWSPPAAPTWLPAVQELLQSNLNKSEHLSKDTWERGLHFGEPTAIGNTLQEA